MLVTLILAATTAKRSSKHAVLVWSQKTSCDEVQAGIQSRQSSSIGPRYAVWSCQWRQARTRLRQLLHLQAHDLGELPLRQPDDAGALHAVSEPATSRRVQVMAVLANQCGDAQAVTQMLLLLMLRCMLNKARGERLTAGFPAQHIYYGKVKCRNSRASHMMNARLELVAWVRGPRSTTGSG